jgi:hypothetical protein
MLNTRSGAEMTACDIEQARVAPAAADRNVNHALPAQRRRDQSAPEFDDEFALQRRRRARRQAAQQRHFASRTYGQPRLRRLCGGKLVGKLQPLGEQRQ